MEPPSRYSKIYSVRLRGSEGKHALLGGCHTQPRQQTLLHGRWWPTNHGDDSKNVLAKSITSSLLREIISSSRREYGYNFQRTENYQDQYHYKRYVDMYSNSSLLGRNGKKREETRSKRKKSVSFLCNNCNNQSWHISITCQPVTCKYA